MNAISLEEAPKVRSARLERNYARGDFEAVQHNIRLLESSVRRDEARAADDVNTLAAIQQARYQQQAARLSGTYYGSSRRNGGNYGYQTLGSIGNYGGVGYFYGL